MILHVFLLGLLLKWNDSDFNGVGDVGVQFFVDFVFGSSVALRDEEFRLLFQMGTLNGDLGEDGVAQCV